MLQTAILVSGVGTAIPNLIFLAHFGAGESLLHLNNGAHSTVGYASRTLSWYRSPRRYAMRTLPSLKLGIAGGRYLCLPSLLMLLLAITLLLILLNYSLMNKFGKDSSFCPFKMLSEIFD